MSSESLSVTRLLCGGKAHGAWAQAPGKSSNVHSGGHQFVWVPQGKAVYTFKGKAHSVGPNDVMLFPPLSNTTWDYDPLEASVTYAFDFTLSSIPADWPPPNNWPTVLSVPTDDILRPLFEYVVGHGGTYDGNVPSSLQHAILTMTAAFVCGPIDRPHIYPLAYPAPVQRVVQWFCEFIRTTPSQKVTLDDLSVIAGTSAKHLCRLFQDHLGYPPMEALYTYRITRSLIGLIAGQKIETIAHDMGFANPGHYGRRFMAVFGKSPTAMRKALKRGYKPKLPDLPYMG